MSTTVANRYTELYEALKNNLPGQHLLWLKQFRSKALEAFTVQGFPSPREEEWRYTNVSVIEKKLFSPLLASANPVVDAEWLESYQLADVWSLVFIDGNFSADHSSIKEMPEDVAICSMSEALIKYPELVESYLGLAVLNEDHGFIHFNNAWFSDGLFIHVPDNTVLPKPIQFIHVVTRPEVLTTTRNLLIAGTNTEINVIETYIGADNAYLTASITEVFVGKNAHVNLSKLQNESGKAYHFGGTYVRQQRDSRFNHQSFAFGSLLARNEIHTDLGYASECNLNGLYIGSKRQLLDNHTRVNHLEAHATSHETYKGILDDRARGVFQGRVIVHENAQKTDSEMNNRNLLLSNDAEADTKPQLEIYADDVKCAHGVTVGQLDENSIFYLQSRGVDLKTARNMLTFAFANEMVDKVEQQSLRTLVLDQLLAHFPQSGMSKEWF